MKDFYWDIRPKPEYGTVEIRVCDTPLTVDRAAQIAAFAQALARWLWEERPHRRHARSLSDAQPQSVPGVPARVRRHADRCDERPRRARSARTCVKRCDDLAPHAQAARLAAGVFGAARDIDQGNHAAWLRQAFAETGTLTDVVRRQSALWAG